MHFLNSSITC